MGSISLREYIRWFPDDASEPTSTLVVTSPDRHFVDLRIIRPEGASRAWPQEDVHIAPEQLDWAIAGRSSYWKPGPDSDFMRGRWEHWIDSRTPETDGLADEGDNYEQPDGTTLEKGVMENPATGKDTKYEELWKDIDPAAVGSENVRCAVLQVEEGVTQKGSIVLVGQCCQGLLREGDDIAAQRWQWDEERGWRRLVTLGSNNLPCKEITETTKLTVGDVLEVGRKKWTVMEAWGY